MRIPHDSYVLVADGAKMLFFRNEGDAENPNLTVIAAEQQADQYDRDIKTDQAGQKPGSPGSGAGFTAAEPDFHKQAEDRFAAEAAQRINRAALAHPRFPAHTVKTCSSADHIFSLGRMVAIPDNDDT